MTNKRWNRKRWTNAFNGCDICDVQLTNVTVKALNMIFGQKLHVNQWIIYNLFKELTEMVAVFDKFAQHIILILCVLYCLKGIDAKKVSLECVNGGEYGEMRLCQQTNNKQI